MMTAVPPEVYAWTYSAAAVFVMLWVGCTLFADPVVNNNPHARFPDMVNSGADGETRVP